MTFEEVLPAFKRGESIRRSTWGYSDKINIKSGPLFLNVDIVATDWEILPDPLPTDTQMVDWFLSKGYMTERLDGKYHTCYTRAQLAETMSLKR